MKKKRTAGDIEAKRHTDRRARAQRLFDKALAKWKRQETVRTPTYLDGVCDALGWLLEETDKEPEI